MDKRERCFRQDILSIAQCVVDGKPSLICNKALLLDIGEKRTIRRSHGWCGEFVTYVLMLAGITNGSILNRAALNGGHWRPGDNLNRLIRWGQQNGQWHNGWRVPTPGDVIIWVRPNGDHIGFFSRMVSSTVYEYYNGNTWNNTCDATALKESRSTPDVGGKAVRGILDVSGMYMDVSDYPSQAVAYSGTGGDGSTEVPT